MKRVISIIVVLTLLLGINVPTALAQDCEQFLLNPYMFFTCAAKDLADVGSIHLSDNGLIDKSEISFELNVGQITKTTEIALWGTDYANGRARTKLYSFAITPGGNTSCFLIYSQSELLGEFVCDAKFNITLKVDIATGTLCAVAQAAEKTMQIEAPILKSCALTDVSFNTEEVYSILMGDIFVKRCGQIFSPSPIIYKSGDFYATGIMVNKLVYGKDLNLYLANYEGNNLKNMGVSHIDLVDSDATLEVDGFSLTPTLSGNVMKLGGVTNASSDVTLMLYKNETICHVSQVRSNINGNFTFDDIPLIGEDEVYTLNIMNVATRQAYTYNVVYYRGRLNVYLQANYQSSYRYLETFIYGEELTDQRCLKAFLWDSKLSPFEVPYILSHNDIDVSQIAINEDVGTSTSFFKANESVCFKAASNNYDNIEFMKYNITDDSGGNVSTGIVNKNDYIQNGFLWTPTKRGNYYVEVLGGYNGSYLIPLANKKIYVSGDVVANDTYIFKQNSASFLRNNLNQSFETNNENFAPVFTNNALYLTADAITKISDVCIDTVSQDEKAISRYGAFAATLKNNTAGGISISTYTMQNGSVLYSFGDIMRLFNYYSYYSGNLLAVSNEATWNNSATTTKTDLIMRNTFDNGMTNAWVKDWTADKTVTADVSNTDYASGGYSYYLGASPKYSYYGIRTEALSELNKSYSSYQLNFKIKKTSDYNRNTLRVMILLYQDDGNSATDDYKGNRYISINAPTTSWEDRTAVLNMADYVGYDHVRYAIINEKSGYLSATGGVYIDNISITANKSVPQLKIDIERYNKNFEKVLLTEDFEATSVGWQNIPNQCIATDDSLSNINLVQNIGLSTSTYYTGTQSLYLGVNQTSHKDVRLWYLDIDPTIKSYKISAMVYAPNDYLYNLVGIGAYMYNKSGANETFLGYQTGTEIYSKVVAGNWTEVTWSFDSVSFAGTGCNAIRINFNTTACVPSGKTATGYVYIDNVVVTANDDVSNSIKADITSRKFASWYTMGETVVYKANSGIDGIEVLRGIVYNSDNEVVDRIDASVTRAKTIGWEWTPKEPGYYEIEFYGIRNDGSISPVVGYYSNNGGYFELKRKQLAVTANPTKSQNERSEMPYFSITHSYTNSQLDRDIFQAADLVGFKGPRWIHLDWDMIEPKNVTASNGVKYDWSSADNFFSLLDESGYENATVCIMGTPDWAAPTNIDNRYAYTMGGLKMYQTYAPTDQYLSEWYNFVYDMVQRYGTKIKILEVWNEPMIGKTAFWSDTPANYAKILKQAYLASTSANPNVIVSTAGLADGSACSGAIDGWFAYDPSIANYFDILAIHGGYGAPYSNMNVLISKGITNKPWWNSEGYYASYRFNKTPTDQRAQALYFLIENFANVKSGAKKLTFYNIFNYGGKNEDEYNIYAQINGLQAGERSDMFRHYPYIEPNQSAVAAFNLFNIMGSNFEYVSEYTFSGGQKMLRFLNDGQPLLVVWDCDLVDFTLDASIINCLNANAQIKDMEGKVVSGYSFKANRMYYITGVNANALSTLTPGTNVAINSSFSAPYYNCRY